MSELICEDWILYDTAISGIVSTDPSTGQEFTDIRESAKEIRVYGTRDQLAKASNNYKIDEVYKYETESPGSEWYKCEATNEAIKKKLGEYNQLYILNNKKVLILRTK